MNKIKKSNLLFNPFERFREQRLIIVGLIAAVVASLLGYFFNGRFDGALDLHFTHTVEIWEPFIDNLIAIFSLFLIFSIVAKILNPKTRFVDIFAISLIARLPLYLLTFSNFGNIQYEIGQALFLTVTEPARNIPMDAVILSVIFGALSILAAIWMITLLYNGLKLVSNSKGAKLIVGFIFALILAEALSKLIVYLIY